ncbi:putative ribonuclease H-like domain-containing protein [Tanacetum coccineum]
MTGNMSYLSDFKEFDGEYVTFGGGAKGGKITGKGTLKTAITPQQNGIAKRRNKTLIEAARTMLANFKLTTTFWAEAVNTACYVHNRVLVVKPHNKTPYELFRGRIPSLSFMRPFGCHVTILNTLDHLGKFDGKSDDGFFIGYSLNSKAFRVYNIRTRKVEENLHVRFLEDKPIIAGDGPKWLFDIDVLTKSMNYVPVVAGTNSNDFVGTKESIGAGHSSKEPGSSQDYILMPLWKDGSLFDSSPKNTSNDEPQPSSDAGKKDDESGIDDQEKPEDSSPDVNTVGPNINTASINTGSLNINTASPPVTTAPLEATHADFFGDETELDMSNITNTYLVPTTPNTRIHKDHSLDHVIGDVQSGVQTRRMTRTTNEQGFIRRAQKGNPSIKRSKLDRSYARRASAVQVTTGYKKDERGIVIRNKARLVAQGYTQEEGIDYDEVFAPFARIEAIRLFLPYASFKDFVVYQMDVNSAFLYGKIKEEVYVCQPPGFEDPEFPDRVYKKFQISSMGELTFFLGLQVTQKDDGIFISQDNLDRKSTTGDCQFLGSSLISCIWIQNQMLDYGYNVMNTKIFIDNESTICIVKNPVFHSKTKHIEIRHHFIRYSNEKKLIQMIKIHTDQNVTNLLTKAFDIGRFQYLIETSELGEGSKIPIDPQYIPTIIQPSTSQPQKKQPRRKQRKDTKVPQPSGSTEPITDKAANAEHVPTHSNYPLLSGKDRLKLNELMELCTKLSERVLDLENTKTSQAAEITKLKERVKKLERRNKSRTPGLKRLRKEDAFKQGRKIADLDADAEWFKESGWLTRSTAAKPMVVTTAATTTTNTVTRPKARGVVVQEPSEFRITTSSLQISQPPRAKDKGKAKMIEPKKPLKKKDQVVHGPSC